METTPSESKAPSGESTLFAIAFSTKGRAGRLRYLIYLMSYCPIVLVMGLVPRLYVFGIPLIAANYVCGTIQRCHDIGLNGWWAWILGLPGPNLALLVTPGKGANRYGEPEQLHGGEIKVASVMALIAIAAIGFGASDRGDAERREAIAEIQQLLNAVRDGTSGSLPPPVVPAADASDAAKMSFIVRTLADRALGLVRDYEMELDAIGWPRFLDGQRLSNDMALTESRAMLERTKEIVAEFRFKTAQLLPAALLDIENSDLAPRTKQAMLDGFNDASPGFRSQTSRHWEIEEQVVARLEDALNVLEASRGFWRIENDEVVFLRQADTDLFNSHLADVQALAARQEQLSNDSIQELHERQKLLEQ